MLYTHTLAVHTNNKKTGNAILNQAAIATALERTHGDPAAVRSVLVKSRDLQGLDAEDIAVLISVTDPDLLNELFETARFVKERIYGRRLVLFAPLYVSNRCSNECLYCAFRAANTAMQRCTLSLTEIAREVGYLTRQGHKRLLLVAGEAYPPEGFRYILDAIETVYATNGGPGQIRRLNVNIAPLEVDEFKLLKKSGIGTYQLFQETYHPETYRTVHPSGKKADFNRRITAMDRAMQAGINDVGIGVLFGLYDWRFEILALMQHIRHLEHTFGVGCHTISVPRLEAANGSGLSCNPSYPVSDNDFKKIVAVLRLAVPYTGIIMSTRESPELRRDTLALGVSQISAGSRTSPGGYSNENGVNGNGQFSLGDHRSLDEVIGDVVRLNYIPSFCTACYRRGRTGRDFMDLARPGLIKDYCDPNAVSTLAEYLNDYASPETRRAGEQAISRLLSGMHESAAARAVKMLEQVQKGKRDVYT